MSYLHPTDGHIKTPDDGRAPVHVLKDIEFCLESYLLATRGSQDLREGSKRGSKGSSRHFSPKWHKRLMKVSKPDSCSSGNTQDTELVDTHMTWGHKAAQLAPRQEEWAACRGSWRRDFKVTGIVRQIHTFLNTYQKKKKLKKKFSFCFLISWHWLICCLLYALIIPPTSN